MPDSLTPDVVEPLLRGRLGKPYLYEEQCTSTQDLLTPAMHDGTVAVADEQKIGRAHV